jgi:HK97 family phage portal protein
MGLISLNLPNPPVTGKRADSTVMGQPYNLGSLTSLFGGVRTNSGQFVTPQTAMRASAVLACMRIISEDISSLPLNLYRRTPQGAVLATDHPLFRLLHDTPNSWQTSMEVRESMILDTLCYGQSFFEKEIGPDGITALYPLSAGRMVFVNPLDEFIPPPVPLFFRYADPKQGQRILLSDDLWITRMLAPASTIEGTSLILLAREAIGLALAAEEQGARLFQHGVQSDLALTTPETVSDKDQLREAFHEASRWVRQCVDASLTRKRAGHQAHWTYRARVTVH